MDGLGIIETNEILIIGISSSSRKIGQDKTGAETTFGTSKDIEQVRIPEILLLKTESYKIFVDECEKKFLKASFTIEQLRINQLEQPIDKIQWITRRNPLSFKLRSDFVLLGNFELFSSMVIIPAKSSLSEQEIDIIKKSYSYLPGVMVNEIPSIPLSTGAESQIIDIILLDQREFIPCKTQLRFLFPFNKQITLCHDCQGTFLRALKAYHKVYFLELELKTYSYQASNPHGIQFKDWRLQYQIIPDLVCISLISITKSIRSSLNHPALYNFLIKLSWAYKKRKLLVKINLVILYDFTLHSKHENFPDLSNEKLRIICQKEKIYKQLNMNSLEILSALSVGLILQLPRKMQYKETSTKFPFITLKTKLSRKVEILEKKLWTNLDLIDNVVLKTFLLRQKDKYEKTDFCLEKSSSCVDFGPVTSPRLYSSYDGTANEEEERDSKPSCEDKAKMCIGKSTFDRLTGIQETEKKWRLALDNRTIVNPVKFSSKLPISKIRQDNVPEISLGHNFGAPEKSTISVFTDIRIKNRDDSKREKQVAASEQYRNEVKERVAKKEKAINSWQAELEATALLAQSNSRAIVKRRDPAVIDRRFPPAWSRYSSHDRIERLTSALSVEGVKVQDFAKLGLKNDEIIWRHMGDSGKEVNSENCGQEKNLRQKLRASASLFLYKIKLKDIRLQATQAQGRRGSLNVAGEMEFPELELLPFPLMTDMEIENEIYEVDEKLARLRYTEKTEKLEEANNLKILNEGDAGSERLTEEAFLKEDEAEEEFKSRYLSISDIVLSNDLLNCIIVDEVDVTCRATSPCQSISEILFSMI